MIYDMKWQYLINDQIHFNIIQYDTIYLQNRYAIETGCDNGDIFFIFEIFKITKKH